MLTRSTQIPTSVRGKVRALVKAHKYWPVFLRANGLISASAKNSDLIEFALFYPELTAQIEAILADRPDVMVDRPVNEHAVEAAVTALNAHAALETAKAQLTVLEALGPVKHTHPNAELTARLRTTVLAMEVEALLREAGKRAAERYRAKRKAINETALNDFNYVGSRHHY